MRRRFGSAVMASLTTDKSRAEAIVVIDVSNFAFRAYHVTAGWAKKPAMTNDELYVNTARNMFKALRKRLNQYNNVLVMLALDAGRPKDIIQNFPEYKSGRVKLDVNPIPSVLDYLRENPAVSVWADNNEADSAIASLFKHNATAKLMAARHVYVVSRDKDLIQLLTRRNVKLISAQNDPDITPDYVYQKYGIKPSRMAMYLTVYGDSSDSIKPVVSRLRKKLVNPLINKATNIPHFIDLVRKSDKLSEREREGLIEAQALIVKRYQVLFKLRTNLDLSFKVHR